MSVREDVADAAAAAIVAVGLDHIVVAEAERLADFLQHGGLVDASVDIDYRPVVRRVPHHAPAGEVYVVAFFFCGAPKLNVTV